MSAELDPPRRDRRARLRFSIIGPLLSVPPAPRELFAASSALAAKAWRHPVTGLDVRFGVSTLQRGYYTDCAAKDPVATLKNRRRDDIGRFPNLVPASIAVLIPSASITQRPSHCASTAFLITPASPITITVREQQNIKSGDHTQRTQRPIPSGRAGKTSWDVVPCSRKTLPRNHLRTCGQALDKRHRQLIAKAKIRLPTE